MKPYVLAGLFAILPFVAAPARADDPAIERLATCQDSWFEWKSSGPARLQSFINRFRAEFLPTGHGGAFTPKSSQTVAGLPVAQVYPESVGMGVGFSVIVNATFDTTKATLEKSSANRSANASRRATTCAPAVWRWARRRPSR